MNSQELIDTARTLVADDKDLLAMDESNPTCNKVREFPTGIDRRDNLGLPGVDVYYGMADNRIGEARLDVPAHRPPDEAVADGSQSGAQLNARVHA